MDVLESVPNFSEGRDSATIEALEAALSAHARILDRHADADHNRCVFTIVGSDDQLIDALVAATRTAIERIDLRRHLGQHPRIGAADVLPIVPLEPADLGRARDVASRLAGKLGALGLPVFLYAPPERGPAFYRDGGSERLARRLANGELRPDFGPTTLHPSAGAVLVGARGPLIAFNVNLRGTLEDARAIAAAVRERDGGLPGVRALGLELAASGLVQISMNVEDYQASPLQMIVDAIADLAQARGVEPAGCELVGLAPAAALLPAAAERLGLSHLDSSQVLELRLHEP